MRDQFLQLPDRRLRARWFGPTAADQVDTYSPTLVFLHEGLACIELWRTLPEALCTRTGLRGFAYDRTGYGQSSAWPSPPGTRYMAIESDVVLPQVLDAAGIESCLLIGHGDGGTIALSFAAAQPPLLRGVVTIGAHAITEARTLSSMRQAREAFLSGDLRERLARYHRDNVDGAFWLWNDAWLTPGFDPLDAARLPRVRVPVLALQGEHDEYGTITQLHAIARGVSGRCETRRMTGCGHAPHLQDEATVVEVIGRFVATLWRGPSTEPVRTARALLLALTCVTAAAGLANAQPDACGGADVQRAIAEARSDLERADDEAAANRLSAEAEGAPACEEIAVAALAVEGWTEARRLALVGGAPDALGPIHATLARLEALRAAHAATALLSQLAAYADAALRAGVAAAQDERDEMQVYLTHARALAESLGLAGYRRPWPLDIDLIAGELWLEVDRFDEARDAFGRVADGGLGARASVGLGHALERLHDVPAACAAYQRAAAGGLVATLAERARSAVIRLQCPPS